MRRITENTVQDFEMKHIKLIKEVASETTLFLKQNGDFPLASASKIAAFGKGVRHTIKGGTGSGDVHVRDFETIEKALENAGFTVTSKKWLDSFDVVLKETQDKYYEETRAAAIKAGVNPMIYAFGQTSPDPVYDFELSGEGDTAIYVLSRISGEGSDRRNEKGDIKLSDEEIRDILKLNNQYDHFMLVLNVGGMVDLRPVLEVENILLLGQLGGPTGQVLSDVLLGKANPSGKLTMTWTTLEDYPSTDGFGDWNDTYYNEGIYVGYRYFDTVNKPVLFPFGYGLSYTDFEFKSEKIDVVNDDIKVTATVKNVGQCSGKEVLQLYVSLPSVELNQPYQTLAAFVKTPELSPEESADVVLSFKLSDLASFDQEKAAYILEKGDYILRLGNSSRHTEVIGRLQLDKTTIVRQVKNVAAVVDENFSEAQYQVVNRNESFENTPIFQISSDDISTEIVEYIRKNDELLSKGFVHWEDVLSGKYSLEDFTAQFSEEELARIALGHFDETQTDSSVLGSAAVSVAGGAGETSLMFKESHGLPSLVMADGPAGLRISSSYKIINGKIKSTGVSFGDDVIALLGPDLVTEQPSSEEINATEYYQPTTAIPIGTDLAQSFNLPLIELIGNLIAEEMTIHGVQLWLAPALNIMRSPLCGRNFEYYSEDPLVSGLVAAAITKGVQTHPGCGVTIKHYAANNQETNRYTSNSILSERALREIYLRGFEIVVKKANPASIMSSYNLINGQHINNRRDLMTDVLRDEWQFKGFVMTDWLITTPIMLNPNSKYKQASAAGCVLAGNDMTMPGMQSDMDNILEALHNESHPYHLTKADLQAAALSVLSVVKRLSV
ncbi:glycoside hydrolase family 3 N-terminal domain-containing protein [Streptococcus gallolyticus]|uniref:Beta-glucosidase n=1 Tax=Streptococcus gallolyticus TaxID=315405 RepID=A0A1H9LXI5_9STRE|nr:glycoside hydrolase family 3 N-terminal domain-containing protein [Streptococcus gallolyticus]SER16176.1 beta-glucosidase [Streptococcus gallolyticus]